MPTATKSRRSPSTPRNRDYRIAVARNRVVSPAGVRAVRRALTAALVRHNVRTAELSVALVDDATMRRTHRDHLGRATPTDVLSFDLADDGGGVELDGELVICVDTAMREAKRRGHSIDDELSLYAVHGLLHLLGFDDRTPLQAAAMRRETEDILTRIGCVSVLDRP